MSDDAGWRKEVITFDELEENRRKILQRSACDPGTHSPHEGRREVSDVIERAKAAARSAGAETDLDDLVRTANGEFGTSYSSDKLADEIVHAVMECLVPREGEVFVYQADGGDIEIRRASADAEWLCLPVGTGLGEEDKK